jgi:hypothetical protein
MDSPCHASGLSHVSVSFDRPTEVGEIPDTYHVFWDLSNFSLCELLGHIWHLTGLHPDDLLGVGAHPPCETFSLLACSWGNRDHSLEGFHLPIIESSDGENGAAMADNLTANCFSQLFPNVSGLGLIPQEEWVSFTSDLSYLGPLFHRENCDCCGCQQEREADQGTIDTSSTCSGEDEAPRPLEPDSVLDQLQSLSSSVALSTHLQRFGWEVGTKRRPSGQLDYYFQDFDMGLSQSRKLRSKQEVIAYLQHQKMHAPQGFHDRYHCGHDHV